MNIEQNRKLKSNARALRKRMTKEERHLWYDFLSRLPVHFRRQQIIGSYIADFYCHNCKLVIELDGSQHFEPEASLLDQQRDAYLRSLGLTVLRYTNNFIHSNFREVCEDILNHLSTPATTPSVACATAPPEGEP